VQNTQTISVQHVTYRLAIFHKETRERTIYRSDRKQPTMRSDVRSNVLRQCRRTVDLDTVNILANLQCRKVHFHLFVFSQTHNPSTDRVYMLSANFVFAAAFSAAEHDSIQERHLRGAGGSTDPSRIYNFSFFLCKLYL